MKRPRLALWTFGLVFSARLASAQTTTPTVNCHDPANGRANLVITAGSSAMRPFLAAYAPLLAKASPPYTIVYQSQGSCTGVSAIFDPDPAKRVIKDIPAADGKAANYAIFFEADGSAQECFLDETMTETWPTVDLGLSDVYADSCGASAPDGVEIEDYPGPIQPMTFIVPAASSQTSISAEAAYLVFGLGGGSDPMVAAPWTDPTLYFVRNASSGTQQMLARAIDVPAAQWWGIDRGGSGAVRTAMKTLLDPATAEKAIGIVSVDVVEAERGNLRALAFKSLGQDCGYLPDSTANARDKQNVRDGHYPVWGPEHLYARTTQSLPSAPVTAFVTGFSEPRPDPTLLDAVIGVGLLPQCAMQVSRSSEMGPLVSQLPPFTCGCYFDEKTQGRTDCQTCTVPADCPSDRPACNLGYCELQ